MMVKSGLCLDSWMGTRAGAVFMMVAMVGLIAGCPTAAPEPGGGDGADGECTQQDGTCENTADCCDGLECTDGTCQTPAPECIAEGDGCSNTDECCEDLECTDGTCQTAVPPVECTVEGDSCDDTQECCDDLECVDGACAAEEPTGGVSFATEIQAIFDNNCTLCHVAGGIADAIMHLNEGESFDALVDKPSVQDADFTRVVPGDSANSLLFLKVSSATPPVGTQMPLGGAPLSQADQDLIRDWIDQGAENN